MHFYRYHMIKSIILILVKFFLYLIYLKFLAYSLRLAPSKGQSYHPPLTLTFDEIQHSNRRRFAQWYMYYTTTINKYPILLKHSPFHRAYVATKKKGNCTAISHTQKDLNQGGGSAIRTSLKLSQQLFFTSTSCKHDRSQLKGSENYLSDYVHLKSVTVFV